MELRQSVKEHVANSEHLEGLLHNRREEIQSVQKERDKFKEEAHDSRAKNGQLEYQLNSQRNHSENLVQKLRETECRLDEHRMINTKKYMPFKFSYEGDTGSSA